MKIDGTTLSMFRGDTEALYVSCKSNKISRPFVTGDAVYFTLKKNMNNTEKLVYKAVTEFIDGKALIDIDPADTNKLTPMRYVYDVKIVFADGESRTAMGPACFEIKAVVYGE